MISPQSCVGLVKVSFFAFVWMIINHCNFIINYILFWPRILYIKCLKILLRVFFLSLLFHNIDYSHRMAYWKKNPDSHFSRGKIDKLIIFLWHFFCFTLGPLWWLSTRKNFKKMLIFTFETNIVLVWLKMDFFPRFNSAENSK